MVSPRRFNLVQRFMLKVEVEKAGDLRFLQLLMAEYMGSAEFESDLLQKFIFELDACASPEPIIKGWILQKKIHLPPTLQFFDISLDDAQIYGAFNPEKQTLESVSKNILEIVEKKAHLQEHAGFPPAPDSKTVAWAEIREGVFWSIIDLRDALPGLLARSAGYIKGQNQKVSS